MRYAGRYEVRYSLRGHPFYVWKRFMPRINDKIVDSVVYLYPSVDAAKDGERFGGTGFLVSVPSEVHEGWRYQYCVTNSHVIREAASPVVRLNTNEGGLDIVPLQQDHWWHHQFGDDLAVCSLDLNNPEYYKYSSIDTSLFVTKDFIEQQNIGPGDDVFMVGRFVSHQGRQRNTPVVRFGNISMMPGESIRNARGLLQESFLIETRSLSGFSGSPVFLYITPVSPRPAQYVQPEQGTWLLGVDWGHMRTFEAVMEKDGKTPVSEEWVVPSNSGQMGMVPAWTLLELLDREELLSMRRQADDLRTRHIDESPAVFDAHKPIQDDTTATESLTQNAFENALDRVSRPEKKPDEAS